MARRVRRTARNAGIAGAAVLLTGIATLAVQPGDTVVGMSGRDPAAAAASPTALPEPSTGAPPTGPMSALAMPAPTTTAPEPEPTDQSQPAPEAGDGGDDPAAEDAGGPDASDPEAGAGTSPGPAGFPDASTTGVPPGTSLTPYTGPCTITADGTVIDGRTIECSLTIQARDVVVRNSKVNGSIDSGNDPSTGFSFTLEDSELDATPGHAAQVTGVGSVNFTVVRSNIYGGNRSANCWVNCTIVDSFLHGQDTDESGTWHESAVRMGSGAVIRGSTILCDAPDVPPDAGCSANLTGYGDFATVQDNRIEGNLFRATTGGFCAYGGSTAGKPYPDASGIVFVDNVFERGPTGSCGQWGAITDFSSSAAGNQWSGNVWDDGTPVTP